ncbi:MAG: hypothetical protein KAX82_05525, partial [Burkholderiales bacterium]|nr:hypothetical protein [Burkholderiales bacterium]
MPAPASAPLTSGAVLELRTALSQFGRGVVAPRRAALSRARRRGFADASALLDYHDLMLFLRAHPATLDEYAVAARELERVAAALREIAERGRAVERRALEQSGAAWTPVRAAFGLAIARWLVARHPGKATLDSVDDEPLLLAESLA